MLSQPAQHIYRTWIIDSTRWESYRPRPTDIIIATYPKCGTTWMQRIVDLLVFQTPEPRPIQDVSPWIERRFPVPLDAMLSWIEGQEHRRFLKSHLPFDGLPIHEEVKYIHVVRDGRDACMSFHNHGSNFTAQMLDALDRAGLADEAVGRPYPRIPADPAEYFHRWITQSAVPGHEDGLPTLSFFHCERTWWDQRHRPNVLLVHYNDLKTDLSGEMQRVAEFLGISVASSVWPRLVEAASFQAMRQEGATLMMQAAAMLEGGSDRFFHKGTNARWRGVVREDDLALYEAKMEARFSPACRRWVERGRLGAGDPCQTTD